MSVLDAAVILQYMWEWWWRLDFGFSGRYHSTVTSDIVYIISLSLVCFCVVTNSTSYIITHLLCIVYFECFLKLNINQNKTSAGSNAPVCLIPSWWEAFMQYSILFSNLSFPAFTLIDYHCQPFIHNHRSNVPVHAIPSPLLSASDVLIILFIMKHLLCMCHHVFLFFLV